MRELVQRYLNAAKGKDIQALDGIFTQDAVYIETNGATYTNLTQIKQWFEKLTRDGSVTAWDIRKIVCDGENAAVQWYYEYRSNTGECVSRDGVALIEISDCKIKRWSEFSQTVNKTYPYQV